MSQSYHVKRNSQILQSFETFTDAWLYARLEQEASVCIEGPDGVWLINPGRHHLN